MNIEKIAAAKGEITVPGDKSISHRAVMLGSLAKGTTKISGFLPGADCLSTIDCFREMGIDIKISDTDVEVIGKGLYGLTKPQKQLYTGNSGTTTRLLCGILSGQSFDTSITGDESICKRPMKRVSGPLSLMGANIKGDYCPLTIYSSKLHSMEYEMKVASAQVKTAIILAALYAEGETVIYECEKSRDHTELMLKAMGADIDADGLTIRVKSGKELKAQNIEVPGDISSAAFFIVLGAILPASEITIKNVGVNPTRTGIIDVMKKMNADITLTNERIATGEKVADIVIRTSKLKGCTIEGDIIPRLIDEIPIIAVAAAFAEGETIIRDAGELKVKETNRIAAVTTELKKCGIDIEETDDGMIIRGGKDYKGADFKSYGDHRMAMSLSVLAQMLQGNSTLDDTKCVDISYPTFFKDFYSLG